jgi:DNA-binding CsgD family transcriptional regulator
MEPTAASDGRPTGRRVFSPAVWSCIAKRLALSERELQIVQGVFDDAHQDAIAEELAISSHTVHTHLERLYHKLQVTSRVQLVVRIAECHVLFCQDLCQAPQSKSSPLCPDDASGRRPLPS